MERLDQLITRLKSNYSPDLLEQLRQFPTYLLEIGMPALLSALFRVLVQKDQLNRRQKHEIMKFIEFCILKVCGTKFLKSHGDKINILFERLLDTNCITFNTFSILDRMVSHGISSSDLNGISNMLFVHYANTDDPDGKVLETMKCNMKLLKGKLDRPNFDLIPVRWRSEILAGYSCIFPLSKAQEVAIKPCALLNLSPLINNYEFYESHCADSDMLLLMAEYSENRDILESILMIFGQEVQNSIDIINNPIILTIEKRKVFPEQTLVSKGIVTEKIMENEELFDLIVCKVRI